MNKDIIENLRKKLTEPLPGRQAQIEMSHVLRRSYQSAPANAQLAGVMILLYPEDGLWKVVFTQRTSKYANDKHKGQMSFPGGKMEMTDRDLEETAKRETHEEIGVHRGLIQTLGNLSDLYIPVSNFKVQPVVGYVEEALEFVLEENEVAELVSLDIDNLCSNTIRKTKDIKISGQMTLKRVPYFNIQGKVVWGATAMILNEFVTLFKHKSAP